MNNTLDYVVSHVARCGNKKFYGRVRVYVNNRWVVRAADTIPYRNSAAASVAAHLMGQTLVQDVALHKGI